MSLLASSVAGVLLSFPVRGEACPVFGDGFLHVLKADAEALAFDDEFLELPFEEIGSFGFRGRRALGNSCDRARADFEKASVGEARNYFVGGVGIDLELFAEGADGREFVPGTKLARDD